MGISASTDVLKVFRVYRAIYMLEIKQSKYLVLLEEVCRITNWDRLPSQLCVTNSV